MDLIALTWLPAQTPWMPLAVVMALALSAWAGMRLWRRLQLSLAKHRSLAGHSRMAQRVARWLPGFSYDEARFFNCDGAPAEVQARRRAGFRRLAATLSARHARTLSMTRALRDALPDLQFTSAYRVPFPFSAYLRQHVSVGAFMARSEGVKLTDLDGRVFYDLTGSYGVNLLGQDVYKACIAEGAERVAELGPVLGSYHPCVLDNVERLQALSGHDAVSFHMSGTEAVMQAVRLARYHTGRRRVVRFTGAYHGWWDDVQPGPGNPMPPGRVYTLKEVDEDTLRVLATRSDIACVLVNPLQALHPNRAAPSDSALLDSSRTARYDKAAYTDWLQRLRRVCSARGIVLIFDEVFMGFRLGLGGAQAYFGVRADLVTYGKTLGGGLPVGVVCGPQRLMQRYREHRPADICFARGTFNAHPYVMGAMNAFLRHLDRPSVRAMLEGLDERWNSRCAMLNALLAERQLPVRVTNLTSVWTVSFTQPARHNWMLQFYLREQGLALSWVGTGRLIFSHNLSDAEFEAICERFLAGVQAMQDDGWWWTAPAASDRAIRRSVLREALAVRFGLARPPQPIPGPVLDPPPRQA